MNITKKYRILFYLSLIGILISGYLLGIHYETYGSICDFNEVVSCTLVDQSVYSSFFGIPVSLYGLVGYSILAVISFILYKKINVNNFLKKIINEKSFLALSTFAVVISLYLTYMEFFVIRSICVFCVLSQVNIIIITFIGYKKKVEKK
jgi:uncharacterized membrane protein